MKKLLIILLILIILISSGCVVDTKSDLEKELEKAAIEIIIGGNKIFEKQTMLSNAKSITSCSKSTNSCTLTWEDTNTKKIVKSATLEVWGGTTLDKTLLFKKTVVGSNGTIIYTIKGETLSNKYIAKGVFETNKWFDDEYG